MNTQNWWICIYAVLRKGQLGQNNENVYHLQTTFSGQCGLNAYQYQTKSEKLRTFSSEVSYHINAQMQPHMNLLIVVTSQLLVTSRYQPTIRFCCNLKTTNKQNTLIHTIKQGIYNISDRRIIKCRLFCLNADHLWTIFPQKSALRTQCGLCGLFS